VKHASAPGYWASSRARHCGAYGSQTASATESPGSSPERAGDPGALSARLGSLFAVDRFAIVVELQGA